MRGRTSGCSSGPDNGASGGGHPETARELEARLTDRAPEAGDAIALVTETFEADRYGGVAPPSDRLRRVREALASLSDR